MIKFECILIFLIFTLLIFVNVLTAEGTDESELKALKETFNRYAEAVQKSDIDNLFTTVTDKEDFTFLSCGGEIIDGRQAYYDFHKNWFASEGWSISFKLIDASVDKNLAYTFAGFSYQSPLPDGMIYKTDSYFTLLYRKENEKWKAFADHCFSGKKKFNAEGSDLSYTLEQYSLFETIKNRRTVRKFKPDPVPKEHILKILDAARYAPTAGNQQPWKFLVIQDRAKIEDLKVAALSWYLDLYKARKNASESEIEQIKEKLKEVIDRVLSAPVYVAVLVDFKAPYPAHIIHDGPLAAGYLMIAARSLGYGTGYFTTFFPEDKIKQFFKIPDKYKLICFTPIGVPDEWPKMPPKKDLDEFVEFDSF